MNLESIVPGGSENPSEQTAFLVLCQVHHPRRLKSLLDPVALFEVVDKHELDSDVTTVDALENTNGNAVSKFVRNARICDVETHYS